MTDDWYSKTLIFWKRYLTIASIRIGLGFIVFGWIIYLRWTESDIINIMTIFWSIVLSVWCYYSSNLIYITFTYFETLAYYFFIRFRKAWHSFIISCFS